MVRKQLRKTLKLAASVLGFALVATIASALVIQFRIRVANDWQQYAPLPEARQPASDDRIIVFAPHCDDETLGCGGLLAAARQKGARVRVVIVTNGDGFRIGAARTFNTIRVTPSMCIKYANRRQRETLSALRTLGVSASSVTFLGYPDRGINALWNDYFSSERLYLSHATATNRSPYSNSYTPQAPYCGESLIADIQRLIRAENPTDVYLPHPSDNHSDHYATYCFVTAAIAQLESDDGDTGQIRMHTYLVHRGDWPVPRGDHLNEPLAPPHALAKGDTRWYSFKLSEDIAKAKRQAIRCYKTQTAVEKGFLISFARKNELFGNLPTRRVTSVANGVIQVDGRTDDWNGITPVVIDAVGDFLVAGLTKGGDVRAVYLSRDDKYLYIRADFLRRLSKRVTYTVNLRWISRSNAVRSARKPSDGPVTERRSIALKPPHWCNPRSSTAWAYKDNVLEIALPSAQFVSDGVLFVQVTTRLGRVLVDNTGWHKITCQQTKTYQAPS
ncbi:MAG: PIG-L family deacetylase [Armatimonadetes bacterium]|nr:PIG-L family deacetylase [Armatimonadota bacterium]